MKRLALALAAVAAGLAHAKHEVELRTDSASCRIDLDGGRVVSYVACGEEQLWMPETPQTAAGWRHGGVPVCWPWFGAGPGGEIHGTAWKKTFELSDTASSAKESRAELTLRDGDRTLRCRVSLTDRLRLEAEVANDGTNDVSYTIGFHPYFRVLSRDCCSVEGLDGLPFEDDPSFPNGTNGVWRGVVRTTGRIDRIYAVTGAVHTCVLREPDGRTRRLVFEGFTDVNVWNPETDPEFDGMLPPGAWRSFLCVEPVRFGPGDEVVLAPGGRRRHVLTIEPTRGILPEFAVDLFDGRTGTVTVASGELRSRAVVRGDGRVRVEWRGHPFLGEGFEAVAEGVWKGGGTEWSFSCSGNASGLPLGRVAFPVVEVPCADDGSLLHSPSAGGGTMGWKRRVRWRDLAPQHAVCSTRSPGFRFVAVLNGEGRDSHYLDVRDPQSNAGTFEVRKGRGDTARLAWIHDMPLTPGNAASCRLPYSATLRSYRGDWFEAASFYREWVRTTPRYVAAKARDISKLRGIGLWMWNRGLAETVVPPVERFQSDTGLRVALDWYWWFKEMPGTFYPDYWPPREGEDRFRAAVRRLKASGAFTQVYLNGMTWDEDVPSWKDGGLDSVAMARDGSYVSIAYNRFNPDHRLANLCGEAPKFHARIREQIAHLVDCGFDSIYLDMIGCNAYGPCFNPAHRHAPGGGSHMTDDFRAFLKGIKRAHPGILLSTEDCGEAYVDAIDSNISTHSSYERHGWIGTAPDVEFVPVFQALYHGTVAVFGNYALVDNVPYWDPRWPMKAWWTGHEDHLRKDFPDQFAVEFSRGPAWGLQPSVHNFWIHHATNAACRAEYRFICDTARFYHDNREFLFDGEMRHPGRLACARRRVAFAKVSVFDEKVDSHESELPVVFHNVWRAPDGRIAAVLVNWSREPQKWRLEAPDVTGEGVLAPRSWTLVPGLANLRDPASRASSAATAAIASAGLARSESLVVKMAPGEKWWGLCNNFGREMPFTESTEFKCDLRRDNYAHQSLSFICSDKGRAVWCAKPVGVRISGGEIALESDGGEILLKEDAGRNLAEAYRYGSRTWFPPTGEEPELLYFSAPQYNTWIELTYHQNERDILAYAKSMIDNGLPPGVFMIDDTWQHGYGEWYFDMRRFGDPKGMVDKLHKMGFKVLLWMCPFVSMDTPAYRRIAWGRNPDDVKGYPSKGGFLVSSLRPGRGGVPPPACVNWWNGVSALLDFTHPNAVAWFSEQLDRLVADYGVDGFKFDGGGVQFYAGCVGLEGGSSKTFAHDHSASPVEQSALYGQFALKHRGSEYRNVFGFAGKPVIMRLHDKAHNWSALQRLIPDMLAAGFVGCPFICPDMVGGGEWSAFIPGAPFSEELFVRSAQVQALCPMMQFSASPWRCLCAENQKIVKDVVALRQRFAPRFVALAKESARTGEPMMRNLEYCFPGQGYAAVRDEFMMGDDLLVAPVVEEGARSRKVVLPPGRWRADDGREYAGPAIVDVAAPLGRLPYFER